MELVRWIVNCTVAISSDECLAGFESVPQLVNVCEYIIWVTRVTGLSCFKVVLLFAIVVLLLPAVVLILLYISVLILDVYKWRHELLAAYTVDFRHGARKTIAAFWLAQGRLWNGWEVRGLEKVPRSGPVMIICYHGTLPIDVYYLISKCQLVLPPDRQIACVVDRFVFRLPGIRRLIDTFGAIVGTPEQCKLALADGRIVLIAPGGVREALFADEFYRLKWKNRVGFARIALSVNDCKSHDAANLLSEQPNPVSGVDKAASDSKSEAQSVMNDSGSQANDANEQDVQPVILPMFTTNCREVVRPVKFGRALLRKLYERTRLPLVPLYGYFPVKMVTHIGDPVEYDARNCTPEQLTILVRSAIERLIAEQQPRIPGSIMHGIYERVEPTLHHIFDRLTSSSPSRRGSHGVQDIDRQCEKID